MKIYIYYLLFFSCLTCFLEARERVYNDSIIELRELFKKKKGYTRFFVCGKDHPRYSETHGENWKTWQNYSNRLNKELAVDHLSRFYQFQERIFITREISRVSILHNQYYLEVEMKHDPDLSDIYLEMIQECWEKYNIGCKNIDELSFATIQTFNDFFENETELDDINQIYDHGLFELYRGNFEEAVRLSELYITEAKKKYHPYSYFTPEICLGIGLTFSEALEYDKAIEFLTEAIEKDPKNKKAYFERAIAFFEQGSFDSSTQDYLFSIDESIAPQGAQYSKSFEDSLNEAISQGVKEAIIDFGPSLCESLYGMSTCLWSFAQHPLKTMNDFTNACYELCENIYDVCCNLDREQFQELTSEIQTFYLNFNNLNDEEKGTLIGSTIGKYGTEIFSGIGLAKSFNAGKKLRDANRLCNLEALSLESKGGAVVSQAAIKHAAKRDEFRKTLKVVGDRQSKHYKGSYNFESGKSVITMNPQEFEGKLLERAGMGIRKAGQFGQPGYREVVDFGEVIGVCYDIDKTEQVIELGSTTKVIIHYSKNGIHGVPAKP